MAVLSDAIDEKVSMLNYVSLGHGNGSQDPDFADQLSGQAGTRVGDTQYVDALPLFDFLGGGYCMSGIATQTSKHAARPTEGGGITVR